MPAFRFLHASDFHLERPPAGLAEMPDHLRDVLVEAPYRAAANVFDAALEHEVDFVLLAGDLVAPDRAGARGILFLRDQFKRLAEQNIRVYWVGGQVDRVAEWPTAIALPTNVQIFGADEPQRVTVARHGRSLCEIVGQSRASDMAIDLARFAAAGSGNENGRVTIGLLHGDIDKVQSENFAYWALGGEHEPTLPQEERPLVHHPGSPQGRGRDELGPHGCTLVEVSETGEICTLPLVTDVVRYASQSVLWPAVSGLPTEAGRLASDLEALLRKRLQALSDDNPGVTLIVNFRLELESLTELDRTRLPLPAIVAVLRGEFGYRSPAVWLDRLGLPPPPPVPEQWHRQETLLGDVLRAARSLQHSGEPVVLDCYLPVGEIRDRLREMMPAIGNCATEAVLHEATSLAAGLLSPGEVRR